MDGDFASRSAAGVRLAASPEGALIGVYEPGLIAVLRVPDLAPIAEIGVDGELGDNDVAFAGRRLIVASRSTAHTRIHVVDPTAQAGPTKLGEVVLAGAMHLAAVAGDHVLASGAGTAIIDLSRPEPTAAALPIRGAVIAAGAMGRDGFAIAAGDALEEWAAAARTPLRRLRLGRPLELAFVGGHADRVWLVPRRRPHRIDVVELARRSTHAHAHTTELVGEPRRVVANAPGDLVAAICGDTAATYVVDLARRVPPLRIDRGPMCDVAWLGARTLVLKAHGQPLELLSIPRPGAQVLRDPGELWAPPAERGETAAAAARPMDAELPATRWSRDEIGQRLAAWRRRVAAAPPALKT
jgi:hypothetical protein